jgi:predicted dehydrogenase
MGTVIVGAGEISPNHIAPVLKYAGLYGICDIIRERADVVAEKYGCRAFYDFSDVLKDENVTAVHICTPHYLHFPMAKAAAEAGKQIVLEKPAVMSLDEYRELSGILNKTSVKCMVVLQNRYNPCVLYIKNQADELRLGKLLGLKGILTWLRDAEYYASGEWRGKYSTEGGGLVINQAPHILDLLSLFGGEIESIKGASFNHTLENVIEVEDTAEAVITFTSGVRAFFYGTNGYCHNSAMDIEFVYENGVLRYDSHRLVLNNNGGTRILAEDVTPEGEKSYWGSGHDDIIRQFYTTDNDFPQFADYEPAARIIDVLVKNKLNFYLI